MLLYLVQHAESKSKQDDPERHLSEKGVREAEAVAAFLRPLGLGVREIWNSGKARAAETAEILARVVKSDHGVRERDGLAPNDSIRPVREQLL